MAIVNKAHQANQTYPFAVSLIESVRAYERTLEKVTNLSIVSAYNCCGFKNFVSVCFSLDPIPLAVFLAKYSFDFPLISLSSHFKHEIFKIQPDQTKSILHPAFIHRFNLPFSFIPFVRLNENCHCYILR